MRFLIFIAVSALIVVAAIMGWGLAVADACRDRGGVPVDYSVCLDPKVLR